MRAIDLTGRTFGRWTVLGPAGRNRHRQRLWDCRCSCGTERRLSSSDLGPGKTRSCGCLRAEQLAARNKARAGRGMSAGQRRERHRARNRRPRPPCACAWCGRRIEAPVKNQKHCGPDCAWQSVLAAERAGGRERRARLTPEQRRARREYRERWKTQMAAAELAALKARLTGERPDDRTGR